jgi:hypothetical protein
VYTNVNLAAPLGAMAFLGTAFLILTGAIILGWSIVRRRFIQAKIVCAFLLVLGGGYLITALGFAITSHEFLLGPGEEKHFCELDCHLAYSIVAVEQRKSIGSAPHQLTAGGIFTLVTIKTRFDETTISANRGDGPLTPNDRKLTIVDELGRHFGPATQAQAALVAANAAGTVLTTPLRPGKSYVTTVVFDLPTDARSPTLLINEADWITHLLIGHENSPLHKKTRFQI